MAIDFSEIGARGSERGMQMFSQLFAMREQIEERRRQRARERVNDGQQFLGDGRNWANQTPETMQPIIDQFNASRKELGLPPMQITDPRPADRMEARAKFQGDVYAGNFSGLENDPDQLAAFQESLERRAYPNDSRAFEEGTLKEIMKFQTDAAQAQAQSVAAGVSPETPAKAEKPEKPEFTIPRLSPGLESKFKVWYASYALKNGLSPDPDDFRQKYDYRGYWLANQPASGEGGVVDPVDGKRHLPDDWKAPGYENLPEGGTRYMDWTSEMRPPESGLTIGETPSTRDYYKSMIGIIRPKITTTERRINLNEIEKKAREYASGPNPNPVIIQSIALRIQDEYKRLGVFKSLDEIITGMTQVTIEEYSKVNEAWDKELAGGGAFNEFLASTVARYTLRYVGKENTPEANRELVEIMRSDHAEKVKEKKREPIISAIIQSLRDAASIPELMQTSQNKGKTFPGVLHRKKKAFLAANKINKINDLTAGESKRIDDAINEEIARDLQERKFKETVTSRKEVDIRQAGQLSISKQNLQIARGHLALARERFTKENAQSKNGLLDPKLADINKAFDTLGAYWDLFEDTWTKFPVFKDGKPVIVDEEQVMRYEMTSPWKSMTRAQKETRRAAAEIAYYVVKSAGLDPGQELSNYVSPQDREPGEKSAGRLSPEQAKKAAGY